MPRILLFLSLLGIASAIGFFFQRDTTNPNSLTLRCVGPGDVVYSNPVFFRYGERYVLVDSLTVAEGVRWEVTRNREGSFQCAETLEGERSAAKVIVALPFGINTIVDPQTDFKVQDSQTAIIDCPIGIHTGALPSGANTIPSVNVQREFRFRDGETAIIDCPIPPGNHVDNYFVRWQSDEENPTLFYSRSFVPTPRVSSFSSRYNIAPGNFSLTISNVNPGDERFRYQCLLGVEADLQNPTGREVYEMAGNVDLSLIVAKSPEFSQQPTSQVAIANNEISFTCSVLSSPEPSTFIWETPVIAEGGTFDIQDMDPEPNSDLEVGGVVSTSVLRIPNAEGRDSGLVKCQVTQESEMLGTQVVMANATLSVLDEVRVDVDQLQNCGLILTVTLERNLTDPVSLNISFTDVKSFRTQTIVTDTQYSNVMVINHVVRRDKIEFCAFTLSVALENGRNNVGPFTKVPGTHHRCPLLSTVSISLIAVSGVLGLLVMFLLSCSGFTMLFCYRYGEKGQREVLSSTSVGIIQRGCCNFGKTEIKQRTPADESRVAEEGDPVSQNGFSDKTAMKYAHGVAVSAKFGLNDDLIKSHIQKYLKEDEDAQKLWKEVVTAVPGVEASDGGAARSGSRVHVNLVEEENPADSDAITKTEHTES